MQKLVIIRIEIFLKVLYFMQQPECTMNKSVCKCLDCEIIFSYFVAALDNKGALRRSRNRFVNNKCRADKM